MKKLWRIFQRPHTVDRVKYPTGGSIDRIRDTKKRVQPHTEYPRVLLANGIHEVAGVRKIQVKCACYLHGIR
jgi:hypothetical protein